MLKYSDLTYGTHVYCMYHQTNHDEIKQMGGSKELKNNIFFKTRQIRRIYIPDKGLFERNM